MKKIISIILVSAFILALLFSCSVNVESTGTRNEVLPFPEQVTRGTLSVGAVFKFSDGDVVCYIVNDTGLFCLP